MHTVIFIQRTPMRADLEQSSWESAKSLLLSIENPGVTVVLSGWTMSLFCHCGQPQHNLSSERPELWRHPHQKP